MITNTWVCPLTSILWYCCIAWAITHSHEFTCTQTCVHIKYTHHCLHCSGYRKWNMINVRAQQVRELFMKPVEMRWLTILMTASSNPYTIETFFKDARKHEGWLVWLSGKYIFCFLYNAILQLSIIKRLQSRTASMGLPGG